MRNDESNNLTKTQTLLIQLDSSVTTLVKTVEKHTEAINKIPLIDQVVGGHEARLTRHGSKIDDMEKDITKAKGWAACIGFIMGIVGTFFGKH
jgi:hypothetical protein